MSTALPAILSVEVEPARGQPCHCFCGARHPGVWPCAGHLQEPGYRIRFNSMYDIEETFENETGHTVTVGGGVVVCRPCGDAYPEGLSVDA